MVALAIQSAKGVTKEFKLQERTLNVITGAGVEGSALTIFFHISYKVMLRLGLVGVYHLKTHIFPGYFRGEPKPESYWMLRAEQRNCKFRVISPDLAQISGF